jgi:hypothetical protein
LEAFLSQQKDELANMEDGFATLAEILGQSAEPAGAAR